MLHTDQSLPESVCGRHDPAQAAFRTAHDLEAPLVMHWMAPFLRADMLVAQVGMGQIERVTARLPRW